MDKVDTLQRQVQVQEAFLACLQTTNSNLQEITKKAKLQLDTTKLRSEKAEQELEQTYVECKNSVSKLGQNLNNLHQQCLKLNSAACPKEPQLLCRLPLDDLRNTRNAVENSLKLLIIKQFQKKHHENADRSSESEKEKKFTHLIVGSDKKKFDQQCRDLEKLQYEYGQTLANTKILDAKNKAYRAAIDFIKNQTKRNDASLLPSSTTSVSQLENDIRQAAAMNAANRANMISLGSLTVKQTRLQYYLDRMNLVNKIMKKQIGIDKIVCHTMMVEFGITQEASQFLSVVGKHFKTEAETLAENFKKLETMKLKPQPEVEGKKPRESLLLEEFNSRSFSIIEQLNQHINLIQNRAVLLRQSGTGSSGASELPMLSTSVSQLDRLLSDFKSDVQSSTLDFMKTKERLRMCQNMKPPVDLWQVFLVEPEKLASYLPKSVD